MSRRAKRRHDRRYAITRIWCGYPRRRHVATFCHEWIGHSATRNEAVELIEAHQAAREAQLAKLERTTP